MLADHFVGEPAVRVASDFRGALNRIRARAIDRFVRARCAKLASAKRYPALAKIKAAPSGDSMPAAIAKFKLAGDAFVIQTTKGAPDTASGVRGAAARRRQCSVSVAIPIHLQRTHGLMF